MTLAGVRRPPGHETDRKHCTYLVVDEHEQQHTFAAQQYAIFAEAKSHELEHPKHRTHHSTFAHYWPAETKNRRRRTSSSWNGNAVRKL
jgi:hypothetical protein